MKQLCNAFEITLSDPQPAYYFAHIKLGGWLWSDDNEERNSFEDLWIKGIIEFHRAGKTVVMPPYLKHLS